MEKASYLVFSLHGSVYGLSVSYVREILFLPELTPVTEAPPYISGMFNFRSRIVPVMDLHARLGYKPRPYQITDRVIVLEWGELALALIANRVHDVLELASDQIEPPPAYGQDEGAYSRFFEGLAKVDEDIITLLNLEQLVHQSASLRNLYRDERDVEGLDEIRTILEIEEHPVFMPGAGERERTIFHDRAVSLLHESDKYDMTGLLPLAVAELNKEYLGIELEAVMEFTYLRNFTPVPCCPDFILGCMNRRGFILTVVDISGLLNMPIRRANLTGKKVVVVNYEDIYAGVLVDDVLDVLYVSADQICEPPSAVKSGGEEYVKGTYSYGGKMLGLLDLKKIILGTELVVNESV